MGLKRWKMQEETKAQIIDPASEGKSGIMGPSAVDDNVISSVLAMGNRGV